MVYFNVTPPTYLYIFMTTHKRARDVQRESDVSTLCSHILAIIISSSTMIMLIKNLDGLCVKDCYTDEMGG